MSDTIRLFVPPYAGGNSFAFNPFKPAFAEHGFELLPLELPGHGGRISEPLLTDIEAMVEDLFQGLVDRLAGPFAFWGHSMGGLLAWLLVRRLETIQAPKPLGLVASGFRAPHLPCRPPPSHDLPYEDFLNVLRRFGGLPEEALNHPVYMEYAEPIIRADFKALDTYVHRSEAPLSTPIAVMVGEEDDVTADEIEAWQAATVAPIRIQRVAGAHFFIHDDPAGTARRVSHLLADPAHPDSA